MDDSKTRSPRFTIHQLVEIQFSVETFIQAEGINLSETGVLCSTESPVDPYTKVFIMIEMQLKEGNYTLKTEGVVVRCEKMNGDFQVGIQFESEGSKSQKIGRKLLALA